MRSQPWWTIGRTAALLAMASMAGGLTGAAAAFLIVPTDLSSTPPVGTAPAIEMSVPTTTVAEPSLIRLEPRISAPVLPPQFISRRASP
ncbi:hypothetical protein L0Y59_00520, partial [Candidatus Uhrbacteria bacterium]|nr:hypothetical protein [Candidatus Uhrbacteria bacterium]